ncbi:hydroxyacylglutathione hydrolase [Aurantiacibacter gangjinensis]|uniref:Hydroxyacylglutathione hydrolase n=1 Tax=Aurantiacibacter gangjinensis TaxID=502682 RepID=A0A0G9MPN4_9SPHN|nr:hydroxyacylglutathione hydrolase [Aurantiacibacter gangjinensis]APE28465.1 Hydroxyacylglutathione hydrolase [Aurantiacibacter gangjinensis]KLE32676.1 hydroxyacylglutathione hydrolase [Aurantiacibacter gangjinensis]
MTLSVHQFPCLSDNYGFLLHDTDSGEVACIDTPDADEILKQAEERGLTITQIWNTHWHPDHAGGNLKIKNATGCTIVAPQEVERIAPIDRVVSHDDVVKLGEHRARIIDVGGHTKGHIAYHLSEKALAFVGDSVFALGCGRMFEGTPEQFWTSLQRIKALPPETVLLCAHEYTEANAKFALHADPDNAALREYADWVTDMRGRGEPTVPTTLERELDANPFLRADTPEMQARWGGEAPHETFAALRAAKDAF